MGTGIRQGARTRTRTAGVAVAVVVALAGLAGATGAGAGTVLVSRAPTGEVGNDYSDGVTISRDGRFVSFISLATNLVASPTASGAQLYVRDRATGTNEMMSVSATGDVANENAGGASISDDGNVVAFNSEANNLAAPEDQCDAGEDRHGNPRRCWKIYARNRSANTTVMVSKSWNGDPADGTSGDITDITADGRFVVFASAATNLVSGDTNGRGDVFLRDLQTETTTLISVAGDGTQGNGQSLEPTISGDGRFIAFASGADNLAPGGDSDGTIYVVDRVLDTITAHGVDGVHPGGSYQPSISDDGSRLAYLSYGTLVPEDTDPSYDDYTEDVATGVLTILNVDSAGNVVPNSDLPRVTADGAYVVFRAPALRPEDSAISHLYRRRVSDGALELVTAADDGREILSGSAPVQRPASADGRFVAFAAPDPTVAPNDTNNTFDIFVHDFGAPPESATGTGAADSDTEADGATYLDPVETTVTGPPGSTVSISEVDPTQALPDGFVALGQQADVHVTPGGTVADPIVLTFRFDASLLPPGADASTVHLFRNGAEVPDCTGAPSATPDPCVSDRVLAGDGDVVLTARSAAASAWNGAIEPPRDTTPPQIDVSAPSANTSYLQGSVVPAQYSCTDDFGPVDLTCAGDVAVGSSVDTATAGAHTFQVHAVDAAGNEANASVSYTVITDESVSIGHTTVVEGDSTDARSATFAVTLNRPADHTVTVRWATAAGSAAGNDFTAKSGTLKFAPAARTGLTATTKFVTIPIRGDTEDEDDEYFTVGLSNATGGYHLGPDTAYGVIVDDDATTGLRAGVGDATVFEGDVAVTNPAKVWVTLSSPVPGSTPVSVRLTPVAAGATSGVDHKRFSARTVVFRQGQWRKAVSLAVLADTQLEGSEQVQLVLSAPTPGLTITRDTGAFTIADDD